MSFVQFVQLINSPAFPIINPSRHPNGFNGSWFDGMQFQRCSNRQWTEDAGVPLVITKKPGVWYDIYYIYLLFNRQVCFIFFLFSYFTLCKSIVCDSCTTQHVYSIWTSVWLVSPVPNDFSWMDCHCLIQWSSLESICGNPAIPITIHIQIVWTTWWLWRNDAVPRGKSNVSQKVEYQRILLLFFMRVWL